MALSRWKKWLRGTSALGSCPRRTRVLPQSRMCLERLEDRTVPSTLDITGGSLTYTASAGIQKNLTIGLASGNFSFTDAGETITLSPGALAAGWTGSGTNTVVGPAASVTTNFTVNLLDGDDALEVDGAISVAGAVSLQSGQDLTLNGSITSTGSGNITLQADNPAINQVINPGTGTVILEPVTQSLKITVGTASVLGFSFGLTNSDLGWITSGVTQIGVAADKGDITVTATIDATPSGTAPSRSQTLSLTTGGLINDNDGFGRIIVQNLDLNASGSGTSGTFTPTVSLTNTKNGIANLTGGSQNIFADFVLVDHVRLNIGSLTGLDDLTLTAPTINLTADLNITGIQNYDGPVTLGANVTLTGIGITFESTVESPGTALALTVNGSTQLDGSVGGGGNPLASLNLSEVSFSGQSVTTVGAQVYGGVGLNATPTTLTSTGNQSISFGRSITLGGTSLILSTTALTTLSPNSDFEVSVSNSSTSELLNSSGGGIDLGGATLSLGATNPVVGQTYTIVSSPLGLITSTFAGLPDGSLVSPGGASGVAFRIHYTATAVTLTDTLVPPTITSANNTTFNIEGGIFEVTTTGLPTPTIKETGALPGGVTFTDFGSGTAQIFLGSTAATYGVFPITITASNGVTPDATQQFTLTISPPAMTPNQAYVANVYHLLFDRTPDPSSSVWVNLLDNGASPASVVLAIEGSTEYLNDQVTAMYQRYLQRQPDTGGAQHWVNLLQAGGTFEEVAEGLTSSQEYYVLQGGTNQGFVTGLYQEALNRQPSNVEVAGWETALDNGESRVDVSAAFLTSQEYRTNLVEDDYMTFLQRQADPGGLQTWVGALNAGITDQQVLASIFGSTEGYLLWS
jgi:Domain of unknown function (DUF4214)